MVTVVLPRLAPSKAKKEFDCDFFAGTRHPREKEASGVCENPLGFFYIFFFFSRFLFLSCHESSARSRFDGDFADDRGARELSSRRKKGTVSYEPKVTRASVKVERTSTRADQRNGWPQGGKLPRTANE